MLKLINKDQLIKDMNLNNCCYGCHSRKECIKGKSIPQAELCIELSDCLDEIIVPDNIHELVSCRDCKFAHMTSEGECKFCDWWADTYGVDEDIYISGDNFCSHGELKDIK